MSTKYFIEETSKGFEKIQLDSKLLTQGRIFLTGEITEETAADFMQMMLYLSEKNEPVHIYINSLGGNVNAGLAIYDILQGCRNEIYMHCFGQASSMAAVILASGQKGRRFILPNSRVMIHEVLLNCGISGSATSISRLSDSITETRDIVNGILAKHTGKTLSEINRATCFDNTMNAEEAVKFGICDEITTSLY
ncbi:MAG: ATP-dependent Clp protease proteolytic subunit [Oscillospiraceae bacterium]|nr:ATP-dependent Clp protease proteolytic subunit [Oscillospiraceae bacterium]